MCIDLFSPGYCLDISFLLEQIWIKVDDKNPSNLIVQQVVDARIINRKGNNNLDQIWLLLPHDYTSKEGGKRKIFVEPHSLSKASLGQTPGWNWAFDTTNTKWDNNQTEITRPFTLDPPNIRSEKDPNFDYNFKGKILVPDVCFSDNITEQQIDLLADKRICKTLLCLKLKDKQVLEPGEAGWLRLVCTPIFWESDSPVKYKTILGINVPFWFEKRLSMLCPIMLRSRIDKVLDSFKIKDEESQELHNICANIRTFILNNIYSVGTSTRIIDHRLAIIADGIDDFDIYPSRGSVFFGPILSLEEAGYSAFKWSAGSIHNRDMDIVCNAKRIIDMLRYNGNKSKSDLARDLSPSGMHEVFSQFIDAMYAANLIDVINSKEDPNKWLFKTDFKVGDIISNDSRMNYLRLSLRGENLEDNILRIREFSDLHPFQLRVKLKWLNRSNEAISNIKSFFNENNEKK
jgi:hypothetical protein